MNVRMQEYFYLQYSLGWWLDQVDEKNWIASRARFKKSHSNLYCAVKIRNSNFSIWQQMSLSHTKLEKKTYIQRS